MDTLKILQQHQCEAGDFFLWQGHVAAIEAPQPLTEPARADDPKEDREDRRPRLRVASPEGEILFPWEGSLEAAEGDPAAVLGFSKKSPEEPYAPVCALVGGHFAMIDALPLFQIPGSKGRCKKTAWILFLLLMALCWGLGSWLGFSTGKILLWGTLPLLALSVFLSAALTRDDAVWMAGHLEGLLRQWLAEEVFHEGRLTIPSKP